MKKSRAEVRVEKFRSKLLAERGLTRDPTGLAPIQRAFLEYFNAPYTAKTHTEMVLGNQRDGHQLKIICDSTGGITFKDYDLNARREHIPYPRCEFCGAVNARWKDQIIDVQPELVIDSEWIDAFPALPWYLDEVEVA